MNNNRVCISLKDDVLDALDRLSQQDGRSRSGFITRVIKELSEDKNNKKQANNG